MEPYENMYIGVFIFYLGFLAAKQACEINDWAIQLLQQTPYDRKVGDLLSEFEGKNVIIEFKRNKNSIESERKKRKHSKWEDILMFSTLKEKEKFTQVSKKVHFLGYPVSLESDESDKSNLDKLEFKKFDKSNLDKFEFKKFSFEFIPYIELFQEESFKNSSEDSNSALYDWKKFCDELFKKILE